MNYNPFDPKNWDITNPQNLLNPFSPFSPFYINASRNKKVNNNIKKPKKEYIRTEKDDENDKIALIVCIIAIIVAYILSEFVLKKYQ